MKTHHMLYMLSSNIFVAAFCLVPNDPTLAFLFVIGAGIAVVGAFWSGLNNEH